MSFLYQSLVLLTLLMSNDGITTETAVTLWNFCEVIVSIIIAFKDVLTRMPLHVVLGIGPITSTPVKLDPQLIKEFNYMTGRLHKKSKMLQV